MEQQKLQKTNIALISDDNRIKWKYVCSQLCKKCLAHHTTI